MADPVTLRDTGTERANHPAGAFVGRCVDVIDLQHTVDQFPGQPAYLVQKVVLVFAAEEFDEKGQLITVHREYTLSGGKKAALRRHLESWRGKPYTDDEIKQKGIPLDKLAAVPVTFNVIHKTSAKGNVYAYIDTLSPVPKGSTAPHVLGYERAPFWVKRKEEYAKVAAAFLAQHQQDDPGHDGSDDIPLDEEMPF